MDNKKVKVLIVDDSLLFREIVSRELSKESGIEVVDTAPDSYVARDMIIEFTPNVLVLDIEMPRMNGIEFLKRLMPQYPIPVVAVSSQSDNVFNALNAGAVDFVSKPDLSSFSKEQESGSVIADFIRELALKVKIASVAKVGCFKKEDYGMRLKEKNSYNSNAVIAIGASTGGTEAIYQIIKALPRNIPGILVVQHMPPVFTAMYAERLNNSCGFLVKEAQTGDVIEKDKVLIAPGDFHMKVVEKGGSYQVECISSEKVNGHRPSVDVLFDSVADTFGKNAIGVILTGMGADGAKGLLNMRQKGAFTIGQDEQSSVVYGMPKAAYDMGAVCSQAALWGIPGLICSALSRLA